MLWKLSPISKYLFNIRVYDVYIIKTTQSKNILFAQRAPKFYLAIRRKEVQHRDIRYWSEIGSNLILIDIKGVIKSAQSIVDYKKSIDHREKRRDGKN